MIDLCELEKIIEWKPYKSDWLTGQFDRYSIIDFPYVKILELLTVKSDFQIEITQNGGLSNYIELFCFYPSTIGNNSKIPAIFLGISLCSPYAIYGETSITKGNDFFGYNFISLDQVERVNNLDLHKIVNRITTVLKQFDFKYLDKDFVTQRLPEEFLGKVDSLNEGDRILHGIFQWMD